MSAAKLTPLLVTRPTATVAPVPDGRAADRRESRSNAGHVVVLVVPELAPSTAAAKSTMLVPAPGKLMTPAGTVLLPCPNSSHCTPRLELLLASTSTMMAST